MSHRNFRMFSRKDTEQVFLRLCRFCFIGKCDNVNHLRRMRSILLIVAAERRLFIDNCCAVYYTVLVYIIQLRPEGGESLEIFVSNKSNRPLYEQILAQMKAQIMSGELKAGDAVPSIRSLAKSLQISVLTVQKAYDLLQADGFIETTAGKGCYVSAQNQDFYLEEQQKKIEEHFNEAIEIARTSGISLDKLIDLLTLLYEEDG